MRLDAALAQYLADSGLSHVFGVSGANIEHLFYALREQGQVIPVLAKHEANAVTMAEGYFRKTGKMGAVMVNSGGGAFNTLSPLTEALASGIPMLVIAGQILQAGEGRGGFQDSSGRSNFRSPIDAEAIFQPVAVAVRKLIAAHQLREILDELVAAALAGRGPVVLLIPRNLYGEDVGSLTQVRAATPEPISAPLIQTDLDIAVAALMAAQRPLLIVGKEVAYSGARSLLKQLVLRTGALVTVTPDGKGLWDHQAADFAGVMGVMGHTSAEAAFAAADVIVAVGTALPFMSRPALLAFAHKRIISIHRLPTFIRHEDAPGLKITEIIGDLVTSLDAVSQRLPLRTSPEPIQPMWPLPQPVECLEISDTPQPGTGMVPMRTAIDLVSAAYPEADVFVDAGNSGAAAIHYMMHRGSSLFSVALSMGGMGHSFGCAIGAAFAQQPSRKRSVVIAGDGAFYMCGMEIHTAWQYNLPITFILFNNNSHGMCHIREAVYFGEPTRDNLFHPSQLGAGLATMLPGLSGYDVSDTATLTEVLASVARTDGPAVLSLNTSPNEMPPFLPFLAGMRQQTSRKHEYLQHPNDQEPEHGRHSHSGNT